MAWQTEMTLITRVLINDYVQPYTYDDNRIQELIILGGMMTQLETDFLRPYTFDVANLVLSPDPTDATNGKDYGFICIASLKAACIIQLSALKDKAKNAGISVSSDREKIDTTNSLDGDKFLINSPYDVCARLDDAIWKYKSENYQAGYALLGPLSTPNLNTNSFVGFYDCNSIFMPYNSIGTILNK